MIPLWLPEMTRMPEPIILLVEDEPLVLLVAQDALEAGGFAVIPVQLASEAVNMLDNKSAELWAS